MAMGAARSRSSVPGRGGSPASAGYAMAALLVGHERHGRGDDHGHAGVVHGRPSARAKTSWCFAGEQYARAIALFQRKYANALPPSIDVLVNERFLRRSISTR